MANPIDLIEWRERCREAASWLEMEIVERYEEDFGPVPAGQQTVWLPDRRDYLGILVADWTRVLDDFEVYFFQQHWMIPSWDHMLQFEQHVVAAACTVLRLRRGWFVFGAGFQTVPAEPVAPATPPR